MPEYTSHIAEVILHADNAGEFDGLEINEKYQSDLIETDLWVKKGDSVCGFTGANNAIGTIVSRFHSYEQLDKAMRAIPLWCYVSVK